MHKNTILKNKYLWLLLLFTAAVVFCCVYFAYFSPKTPKWVKWKENYELREGCCTAVLKEKRLSLTGSDGTLIWQSEKDYLVQDFLFADLDNNGRTEIIALLWKRGIYGKDRPFWVTDNEEDKYSQHLFIYEISEDNRVKQKWCTSYLGQEISRMKLMEQNRSILLTERTDGSCSLWRWESFGLKSMRNEVKFIAFGDNIIHREILEDANGKHGGSYDFLYKDFKKEIESADLAAIQVESMLVDKAEMVSGYPSFGAPLSVGEAIADAGFDIAVCGGNHALDKGIYGIDVTTSFFEKENITCLGVQNSKDSEYKPYEIVAANGMKLALFSYTYGTNAGDARDKYPWAVHYLPRDEKEENELISDLGKARKESDFLIIFVHWGTEYETEVADEQLYMAQLFARAGADLVIGTHPHVPQRYEEIDRPDGKKMLIYYSLGNFRAHQGMNDNTKTGMEAVIYLEHCYEGVRVREHTARTLTAFVKDSE